MQKVNPTYEQFSLFDLQQQPPVQLERQMAKIFFHPNHAAEQIQPADTHRDSHPIPMRGRRTTKPIKDVQLREEIQARLLQSSPKFGYRNWLIFNVGIHIGRRCGDILTMRISDVWDEATQQIKSPISLREEKTRKHVEDIEVCDELADVMREYILSLNSRKSSDPLFPSNKRYVKKVDPIRSWKYEDVLDANGCAVLDGQGMPARQLVSSKRAPRVKDDSGCLTTRSFCKILNGIGKELGIEHFATHCMRKTFGYEMYKKYKDKLVGGEYAALDVISGLFNHATTRQTLAYIGIDEEIHREMYKNFNIMGAGSARKE